MGSDPFFAVRSLLQLPKGCLGLEPIDQEFAGLERCLAVRRSDRDQDDAVAGLQAAVAVDDQCSLERPAALRLGLDLLERLLGHSGIMLEREGIDLVAVIALAHVQLAHQADEHRQATDALVARSQPVELGPGVEVGLLHAHGHDQPPVKGGKKATSRAPASLASKVAVRLSTAAPKAAPSASAWAWPPLR